ncbi:MAG: hypothetical protein IIY29_06525, partial [Firmicutes bacterium]|nr:hypothetical protein [Bacillota bacterium]
IREMYFVQKVYQEEYVTRFNLFSGLLTLVFILLVLLIGYGYSKTDRVRILDGIFGILPAIILLVPVVCHFLMVAISSVGGWITNFLDWTTLSIGGTPISGVINDHWQAFALAGLALLFAVIFRKKRAKEEEDDEDYLDDLPAVNDKPEAPKKPTKPELTDAEEVKPVEAEVIEPDPIYAEPEPAAPETPEVIEMPAPEEPAAPEKPEAPEL